MSKAPHYLAIIDLGSNSVRLKIDQIDENGATHPERYEKKYVRLSSQMGPEKVLKEAPIQRTLAALTEFRQIIDQYSNIQTLAVATAAVRQANNQHQFLEQVKATTGLNIHVISGEREAYLDYVGVSRTLKMDHGLILDTGGASMELILVENGAAEETISIPIGSVLIAQRYHLTDQIDPANLFDAVTRVDQILAEQQWLNRIRHGEVIALGGSNRALAKVYRWQRAQSPEEVMSVHGLTMQSGEALDIMHQLLESNCQQRAQVRGINKDRADVIIGGLLPLMAIIRQQAISQIRFSNSGLREGLLMKYLDHQLNLAHLQA